MTSGIYSITCGANGFKYVGRSIRIEKRWESHIGALRADCHKNKSLNDDWQVYGERCFSFEILETCKCDTTEIEMEALERKWISSLKPSYNVDPFRRDRNKYMSELMKERWRQKKLAVKEGDR